MRIVVAGYYGFRNAGDELLLNVLLERLRQRFPTAEITALYKKPARFLTSSNVRAVSRWNPWEVARACWRADIFLLGGGGLLQEATGPWNCVYYLGLTALSKLLGARTAALAIGIDPLFKPWNRRLTSFLMNCAVDRLSVRDSNSRVLLLNWGVQKQVSLTPDLVFWLPVRSHGEPDDIKPLIALCLKPYPQDPLYAQKWAAIIRRLRDDWECQVELVPMSLFQDQPVCQEILSCLEGNTDRATLFSWRDPLEVAHRFSHYAFVISQRFHGAVLGALHGLPVFGLSDQLKVNILCETLEQPFLELDGSFLPEKFWIKFEAFWLQRSSLPSRYQPLLSAWRALDPLAPVTEG